MSAEEKTEQASAHKLREARKRGEVASSTELTGAVGFAAVLLTLWMGWDAMALRVRDVLGTALDLAGSRNSSLELGAAVSRMLVDMLWITVPLLAAGSVAAMLAAALQTRGVMSAEPLSLKFERMDPAGAMTRLFSSRSAIDLLKIVLKIALLVGLIALALRLYLGPLVMSVHSGIEGARAVAVSALLALFAAAAGVFLLLGLLDYAHQFYEFMKQNRMSKTERKRERKDQEGDPHQKSEIRARRRELLAAPPVRQGVGGATVLVTNPTHFAVALYYEAGLVELPVVVAKGHDESALQMRSQARRHAVPIMENPPLARSLFRTVELGEYIGDDHVEAVAEVFRWVGSLRSDATRADARGPTA